MRYKLKDIDCDHLTSVGDVLYTRDNTADIIGHQMVLVVQLNGRKSVLILGVFTVGVVRLSSDCTWTSLEKFPVRDIRINDLTDLKYGQFSIQSHPELRGRCT